MKDREEMKKAQYDEFLREKLVIDSIVQKIHEEDQRLVGFLIFNFIMYLFIHSNI
jgi:hypothetical protein